MEHDVSALLNRIAAGDPDALGLLYDAQAARVFNYAKALTRHRELAEDVTHDVFLRIHAEAARIAQAKDPAAYVMAITRNHAYNLLKRGSRLANLDEMAGVTNPPGDKTLFDDAFAALPPSQREAVYLHLVCGYTHKETAAITNAPLVTVKWRYGKALAKLRAYFDPKEDHCYDKP